MILTKEASTLRFSVFPKWSWLDFLRLTSSLVAFGKEIPKAKLLMTGRWISSRASCTKLGCNHNADKILATNFRYWCLVIVQLSKTAQASQRFAWTRRMVMQVCNVERGGFWLGRRACCSEIGGRACSKFQSSYTLRLAKWQNADWFFALIKLLAAQPRNKINSNTHFATDMAVPVCHSVIGHWWVLAIV